MTPLKLANAPCSWGTLEFDDVGDSQIGYAQMLDELVETGYSGTDLGDWGFMPTAPAQLRAALQSRQLTMISAFVPVDFKNPATWDDGRARAVRTAALLAQVADIGDEAHQPLIILADDNGSNSQRTQHAGRISPNMSLSDADWQTFAQGVEHIAQAVKNEAGLEALFHHHCAGYVETPADIDRFLALSDPGIINLVFDTGHYLYGTGQNSGDVILSALNRYAERIKLMHYKDCHPGIATQARQQGWDYFTAIKHGVFCELGQGAVDFSAVTQWLTAQNYQSWIVVEQDIVPGLGTPKASAQRNRDYLKEIGL